MKRSIISTTKNLRKSAWLFALAALLLGVIFMLKASGTDDIEQLKSFSVVCVSALTVGSLLLCAFITVQANRIDTHITKPIVALSYAAKGLAAGDMDTKIGFKGESEIGEIAEALRSVANNTRQETSVISKLVAGDYREETVERSDKDAFNRSLNNMISNKNEEITGVLLALKQLDLGGKQISDTSQIIAQGAAEQAATIEELSASVADIVRQSASSAQYAVNTNVIAEKITVSSEQSKEKMKLLLESIGEIYEYSSKIMKINTTMDDIAFQTNILALNAAVEAARSGANGKGFAVVAEEVKNLATRSSASAKETAALINESVSRVEHSLNAAKSTYEEVNSISVMIEDAGKHINNIAETANQQADIIEQINCAIEQISAVVQSNTAISEECAAASEEILSQIDILVDRMSQYKLKSSIKNVEYLPVNNIRQKTA